MPRNIREGQGDLTREIRRLLDQADPSVGILSKGLASDGSITVVLDHMRVYRVTVKAVRERIPRDCKRTK
jgi:chorismate-pyruvate lyase